MGSLSAARTELLRTGSWSIAGSLAARSLTLIASVAVARLLGVQGFGKYGLVRSTVEMATTLLTFGIGLTASKHVSEWRSQQPDRAGRAAALSILLAATVGTVLTSCMLVGARPFALQVLHDPELFSLLRVAAPYLLFASLAAVFSAGLAGLQEFRAIALATAVGAVVGAGAMVGGAWYHGLTGAVLGFVAYHAVTGGLLGLVLKWRFRRSRLRLDWTHAAKELPILYRFSLPAIVSGAIGGPVVWAVNAYAFRQLDGATLLGLYNAARLIELVFAQLSASLHAPLIVMVARALPDARHSRIRLSILSTWMLGACAGFFACMPELLGIVLGGQYRSPDFLATTAATCLTSYMILYKQGLNRLTVTEDRVWWGVGENLWWGFLLLLFATGLVPSLGAPGLALSFTLAYALDSLVIGWLLVRRGLLPRDLVASRRAWGITCAVIGAAALGASNAPIPWRVAYICLALPGAALCFHSLWRARSCGS